MRIKNVFATILTLFLCVAVFAQSGKKLDKIIKRDYQIIECTVAKISDKTVEYSLPGETVVIVLDVSQIAKIDFASGRSQTFDVKPSSSAPDNSGQSVVSGEIKPNTIAVLPVPYVNADNQQGSEDMAKFAQNDLYNKLLDKSANILPLTVQDLRVTNSLLHKAGIDHNNVDETPIEDLQKILGVDNIIAAKVSFTIGTGTTATTYNSGNAKVSNNNKKVTTNDYSTTTANNQQYYYYTVYFDMYKNGSKIYSQTRKPFLAVKDSWMESVQYLLKRSPIYMKK